MRLDLLLVNKDYDLLFKTEPDFLFAGALVQRWGFYVFKKHIDVIIPSCLKLMILDLQ
jgi:hypothetical protein